MNLIVSEIDKQEKCAQSKSLKEKSKAVVYKGWKYLTDNPNVCKFLNHFFPRNKKITSFLAILF